MKLNKTLLALSVLAGMSSFAHGADQGSGTVNFHGSIIDAPCSIDSDSVNQTVELGSISNVVLADGGKSSPKVFQILLKDCSVETAQTVKATFTGTEGAKGKLGITGTASGASIALQDGDGTDLALGKASRGVSIAPGSTNATMEFAAYVQGDGASVVPGEFSSIANFTLAYN